MLIRGIIVDKSFDERGSGNLSKTNGKQDVDKFIFGIISSKLDEVIYVYNENVTKSRVKKIFNPYSRGGIGSYITAGINGFNGDAIMILTSDVKFIGKNIINNICDIFESNPNKIVQCKLGGKLQGCILIGKEYFEYFNKVGYNDINDIIKKIDKEKFEFYNVENENLCLSI